MPDFKESYINEHMKSHDMGAVNSCKALKAGFIKMQSLGVTIMTMDEIIAYIDRSIEYIEKHQPQTP